MRHLLHGLPDHIREGSVVVVAIEEIRGRKIVGDIEVGEAVAIEVESRQELRAVALPLGEQDTDLAVAIEDAGWEVRDCLSWLYGSGFPRSLAVDKAIDKVNGETDRLHRFTAWMRTTACPLPRRNR